MKAFFGILSLVLAFGATVPYIFDIQKGRARPARSTRMLLLLLIFVTFVVQVREFTSAVLLLTIAELVIQLILSALSIKHGMGGLARLDIACYGIFFVSLAVYLITNDTELSLSMLIFADFVAFLPTIVKNWRDPTSDTWVFYLVGGVFASVASLLARDSNDYAEIIFPLYLLLANIIAVLPVLLHVHTSKTIPPPVRLDG